MACGQEMSRTQFARQKYPPVSVTSLGKPAECPTTSAGLSGLYLWPYIWHHLIKDHATNTERTAILHGWVCGRIPHRGFGRGFPLMLLSNGKEQIWVAGYLPALAQGQSLKSLQITTGSYSSVFWNRQTSFKQQCLPRDSIYVCMYVYIYIFWLPLPLQESSSKFPH